MEGPQGEVFPRTTTLAVGKLHITEKPGFLYRRIWGSQWSGPTLWKIWNGEGGVELGMGHSWGGYVSKGAFAEHADFFRMNTNGQRVAGEWLCTANPELRTQFAQRLLEKIKAGHTHPSISPPDGIAYCQCPLCKAEDDPKSVEPSSGSVNMSNRFTDFFDDIGRRVAKESPESILSFYCYADYTQPPTDRRQLSSNLCAWIAPLRACRLHAMGNTNCESRMELEKVIEGWTGVVRQIAYRTYNYNLAECSVPFSKISVWKEEIPWLKAHHSIGINLETLAAWELYGPHIYLSIRLAYDPAADADAIMDDYFLKFFGPQAGPLMKDYWMNIDRAFVNLKCHSGGFHALHLVYTPEFLASCQALLDRAAVAAKANEAHAARVAMNAEGFKNAVQYIQLRDAIDRGDFSAAAKVYDDLLARADAHVKARYGTQYTPTYLKRFLGKMVASGTAATVSNKVVAVLPDAWRLHYDEAGNGAELNFPKPDFDDSKWPVVATFSKTLDAQGLPDRKTIMWYRVRFDAPKARGKFSLFFAEVDGDATVFVNGKESGGGVKKREAFEVDVSDALHEGANVVAVRVDHSKISDLFLGGILRPVLLIGGPR